MAWVPGFKYDVFLSYARVDEATAEAGKRGGWVAQFHQRLQVELNRKIGRETVQIWRDTRDLAGNQTFNQSIRDAIDNSAVFVALTSRGYVTSDYCRTELHLFCRYRGESAIPLVIEDKHRVFHVRLCSLPVSDWPQQLEGTTGFPFFEGVGPNRDGEPLAVGSRAFNTQIRQLADAICATLSLLARGQSGATRQNISATTPATENARYKSLPMGHFLRSAAARPYLVRNIVLVGVVGCAAFAAPAIIAAFRTSANIEPVEFIKQNVDWNETAPVLTLTRERFYLRFGKHDGVVEQKRFEKPLALHDSMSPRINAATLTMAAATIVSKKYGPLVSLLVLATAYVKSSVSWQNLTNAADDEKLVTRLIENTWMWKRADEELRRDCRAIRSKSVSGSAAQTMISRYPSLRYCAP